MSVFSGKILDHLCQEEYVPFPLLLHVYTPHLGLKFLELEPEDLILLLDSLLYSNYLVKNAWIDYCFYFLNISLAS